MATCYREMSTNWLSSNILLWSPSYSFAAVFHFEIFFLCSYPFFSFCSSSSCWFSRVFIRGFIDVDPNVSFDFDTDSRIRGRNYKLRSSGSRLDLRSHWFPSRIISNWNGLPATAVKMLTVRSFIQILRFPQTHQTSPVPIGEVKLRWEVSQRERSACGFEEYFGCCWLDPRPNAVDSSGVLDAGLLVR